MNIRDPRYSDPRNLPNEIWKDIPGFESEYEVSNEGRVRSKERYVFTGTIIRYYISSRILTPYNVKPYSTELTPTYAVTLAAGERPKHHYCRSIKRLVADAFLDIPYDAKRIHLIPRNHDDLDFSAENLIHISRSEWYRLRSQQRIGVSL